MIEHEETVSTSWIWPGRRPMSKTVEERAKAIMTGRRHYADELPRLIAKAIREAVAEADERAARIADAEAKAAMGIPLLSHAARYRKAAETIAKAIRERGE